MDKHVQKQKGGDNSQNLQAGRDLFYIEVSESDQKDFGIIDEIFNNVIKDLQSNDHQADREHVNLSKKIEINFSDESDRQRVREYFKYAYTKVALIEKRIREEEAETQKGLHSHIFGKYNALKDAKLSNIDILEELCKQFVITGKENNPDYTEIARAFVLFFFDDCTIFEKTDEEK